MIVQPIESMEPPDNVLQKMHQDGYILQGLMTRFGEQEGGDLVGLMLDRSCCVKNGSDVVSQHVNFDQMLLKLHPKSLQGVYVTSADFQAQCAAMAVQALIKRELGMRVPLFEYTAELGFIEIDQNRQLYILKNAFDHSEESAIFCYARFINKYIDKRFRRRLRQQVMRQEITRSRADALPDLPYELTHVVALSLAAQGIYRVVSDKDVQALSQPGAGDNQVFLVVLQKKLDELLENGSARQFERIKMPVDKATIVLESVLDNVRGYTTYHRDKSGTRVSKYVEPAYDKEAALSNDVQNAMYALLAYKEKEKLLDFAVKSIYRLGPTHRLTYFLLNIIRQVDCDQKQQGWLFDWMLEKSTPLGWLQLNSGCNNIEVDGCLKVHVEYEGWPSHSDEDFDVISCKYTSPLVVTALNNPSLSGYFLEQGYDEKQALDCLYRTKFLLKKHELFPFSRYHYCDENITSDHSFCLPNVLEKVEASITHLKSMRESLRSKQVDALQARKRAIRGCFDDVPTPISLCLSQIDLAYSDSDISQPSHVVLMHLMKGVCCEGCERSDLADLIAQLPGASAELKQRAAVLLLVVALSGAIALTVLTAGFAFPLASVPCIALMAGGGTALLGGSGLFVSNRQRGMARCAQDLVAEMEQAQVGFAVC